MRHAVVQEDDFGCGAACVAFIAEKKYEAAIEGLGKEQAQMKGFMCKEIKSELARHGLTYAIKYVKPKIQKYIYQEGVVVFIRRSNRYPYGHYLTYYEGQWMDSWINLPHDNDIKNARSGFRKRLPGRAQYALFPAESELQQ